jgi:hypothetical protein
LNRLLEVFSALFEARVSFGDYSAHDLEPVRIALGSYRRQSFIVCGD